MSSRPVRAVPLRENEDLAVIAFNPAAFFGLKIRLKGITIKRVIRCKMRATDKIITATIVLLILLSANLYGQSEIIRQFADSLRDGDYLEMTYYVPDQDTMLGGGQAEIYYQGKLLLTSDIWRFMRTYNFCHDSRNEASACFARDITGDSVPEVIFEYPSGGNNDANGFDIFSLFAKPKHIASLRELDKSAGWLQDIDGDSLPELIFYDIQFQCWHYGCSNSPGPPLVWKWNGTEYKLANFGLGDQILRELYNINADDYIKQYTTNEKNKYEKPFEPYKEDNYPVELLRVMLWFYYTGKGQYADSMVNYSLSNDMPLKKPFYDEIINKVHSCPYWPQLLKSDWK